MAKLRSALSRLGWRQKVSVVVPLTLLSGAWMAAVTTNGSATATAASEDINGPSIPTVPTTPFEVPGSVQLPGVTPSGIDPVSGSQGALSTLSANGIPTAALLAYQRAAAIMEQADSSCNIDWTLIAAIGRVESDHGRYGGNVLSADGVSTPGIYGIALDGSNNTAAISDTDSGVFDNDRVWDRAVGPMQFIPGTWAVIGVDADGDGRKNPQDIDDAATATAVYLCAGEGDLGAEAGQREAIYRYNHSADYVDLVLSIADSYFMGDYTMVPNDTPSSVVLVDRTLSDVGQPKADEKANQTHRQGTKKHQPDGTKPDTGTTTDDQPTSNDNPGPKKQTQPGDDPTPTPTDPTTPPTTPTSPPGGGNNDPVEKVKKPVEDTVTELEKATAYCQDALAGSGASGGQVQQCIDAYLQGGQSAANTAVQAILAILGGIGGDTGDDPLPDPVPDLP